MRPTFALCAALSLFAGLYARPASAFVLDWDTLDPAFDSSDLIGPQVFTDIDGSGLDVSVAYSPNMWDGPPEVYLEEFAPTPQIAGTLRFTNDRTLPVDPTVVTLEFSEAVLIDAFEVVSISIIGNNQWQEHLVVEGLDEHGNLVAATTYDTSTPTLVTLDTDGDASYETLGEGQQRFAEYGDARFKYLATRIKQIRISLRVTAPGQTESILGWASVGIGDLYFNSEAGVPEPTSPALLTLALVALGAARLRRRPR